jgi:8-oxo-dGTP pyrophosphatase MutT (NUDIX family)
MGCNPQLQSGALPYRIDASGEVRVLLVTASRTRRWTIPKGAAEPHLSLAENAAKEAFEEAGVVGEVAPTAAGMFRAIKRRPEGESVIEVWVYLLKVTEVLADWPEKDRRDVQWVSCTTAAELLAEPVMRRICAELKAAS